MGKIRKYLTEKVDFELDLIGQEEFGNRDVAERSFGWENRMNQWPDKRNSSLQNAARTHFVGGEVSPHLCSSPNRSSVMSGHLLQPLKARGSYVTCFDHRDLRRSKICYMSFNLPQQQCSVELEPPSGWFPANDAELRPSANPWQTQAIVLRHWNVRAVCYHGVVGRILRQSAWFPSPGSLTFG